MPVSSVENCDGMLESVYASGRRDSRKSIFYVVYSIYIASGLRAQNKNGVQEGGSTMDVALSSAF